MVRRLVRVCLFVLTTLFGYYTVWTLLTPFLPPSPLLSLFPDREWAVRIPVLILLVGLSAVGMTTGCLLIETAKRKRQAAGGRSAKGDKTTRKRH
ncbi:SPOSA6832_00951 [Sporobolomyces salmonicolor]|uniref:Dolichol phosphate-mannose biosynthesis regulatory protein n=1 Tax=Sporidiobolus salmonicolor TaxID=5005 RepID=A0A0D6EHH8_SPOSA|nr:SPOSA6832_00951 [Sporobolomyces salmonicolor]